MRNCVIYKITNPSNHAYIGKSVDWENRYMKYKNLNCKGQPAIYNSFMDHGFENHTFEILMQNISEDELCEWEKIWIYLEGTFENGLNCTKGGEGVLGRIPGPETRKRLSLCKTGPNNACFGKPMSDAEKLKRSVSQLGKIITDDTRARMSAAQTGEKHAMFGKNHTIETREQMSKSQTGRIHLEESKKKIQLGQITRKEILCLETGESFVSISEAARQMNISQAMITIHLQGKYKSAKGYHFIVIKS